MQRIAKKISTFFFAIMFMTMVLYSPYQIAKFNTEQVWAGGVGDYTEPTGQLALIEQKLTALKTTAIAALNKIIEFNTSSLYFKEYVLDPIAWVVAKTSLQNITNDILSFVNTGFGGNPAFVTDLRGFMLSVTDTAQLEYIDQLQAGDYLCDAFEVDVLTALAEVYQDRRNFAPLRSTVEGNVDDLEGFFSGDFSGSGGWGSWWEVTQNPQNTPYGAYIDAQQNFNDFLVSRQLGEQEILEMGEGFHSQVQCSGDTPGRNNCTIVKPGQVIEEQLEKSLALGQESLVIADELDEVLASLFSQLANYAVTGVNGLLGLSEGTGYTDEVYGADGNSSYEEAVSNEQQGAVGDSNTIEGGVANLLALIDYSEWVIGYIEEIEDQNQTYRDQYPGCYSLRVPSSILNVKDRAENDIATSEATLAELYDLQDRLDNAEAEAASSDLTIVDIQNEVYDAYTDIYTSGAIPTTGEVEVLEVLDRQELQEDVNDFRDDMQRRARQCEQQQDGGGGSEA